MTISNNKKISILSGITSLETFEYEAFIAEDRDTQDICNFILTLACFYNDYKDSLMALKYLDEKKPTPPYEETATVGEYSGMQMHIFRLQVGQIHELYKLIKKNEKVIQKPLFLSVLHKLDRETRKHWQILVDVSLGKDVPNGLAKAFEMIRHKIGFHYDQKELLKGYKKVFLNAQPEKKAYISRGRTLIAERYYFADAAAQGYFTEQYDIESINTKVDEVMNAIAPALSEIIKKFIQIRGYGFRSVD